MPQSHTTAPWERDTDHKQPHGSKKTIKVKKPVSSLFLFTIKMISKLEMSNNKQWINNNSTTAVETQ